MKTLGSVALVSWLALIGCENTSRLDKAVKSSEKMDKAAPAPSASSTPFKVDRSGTVEDRVARLEDNYARYAEAFDFLGKVYEQQKAQQKAQQDRAQREDPDPDAVFAVDIAPDVKLGQVEGSPQALITIVEAWDFA